MSDKAVELNVAGQTCRVVTTADKTELEMLAAMVEDKLRTILAPGRPLTTQAMLLVAVALAHDVHEERNRREAVTVKAKQSLAQILERVNDVLDQSEAVIKDRSKRRRPATAGTRTPSATAGTPRTPSATAGTPRTPRKRDDDSRSDGRE